MSIAGTVTAPTQSARREPCSLAWARPKLARRFAMREGLDYQTRSDYSHAIKHRIEPLIFYAQAVAEIIRPPRGRTRSEMVAAARDRP
jgi:hypothetical protein